MDHWQTVHVDWNQLAQDRVQLRCFVIMVTEIRFPQKQETS